MRKPLYAMGLPEAPIGGEGITRTSNPEAKLFRVKVEFETGRPVLDTLRAMDGRQAKRFCKNRYPTATVITLECKVK